jgi:hypothetical protein
MGVLSFEDENQNLASSLLCLREFLEGDLGMYVTIGEAMIKMID